MAVASGKLWLFLILTVTCEVRAHGCTTCFLSAMWCYYVFCAGIFVQIFQRGGGNTNSVFKYLFTSVSSVHFQWKWLCSSPHSTLPYSHFLSWQLLSSEILYWLHLFIVNSQGHPVPSYFIWWSFYGGFVSNWCFDDIFCSQKSFRTHTQWPSVYTNIYLCVYIAIFIAHKLFDLYTFLLLRSLLVAEEKVVHFSGANNTQQENYPEKWEEPSMVTVNENFDLPWPEGAKAERERLDPYHSRQIRTPQDGSGPLKMDQDPKTNQDPSRQIRAPQDRMYKLRSRRCWTATGHINWHNPTRKRKLESCQATTTPSV